MFGALIGFGLCASYVCVFYAGYVLANKQSKKRIIKEVSEDELKKAKLRDEGFNNIMNYDLNVALGRK